MNVHVYDIEQGKVSKIMDGMVVDKNGKYIAVLRASGKSSIAGNVYGSAVLYQATSTGLKKIKTLAKYSISDGIRFVEKKLYYVSFPDKDAGNRKTVLYRCNQNGTERTKLGAVKDAVPRRWHDEDGITSKYCLLQDDDYLYKFIYASKKLKKIGKAFIF